MEKLAQKIRSIRTKLLPWFEKKVRKFWPQLLICGLWLIIVIANWLPQDVWLMGYDNMLPELNLSLATERSIYSVWQDYRGLGVTNSVMDGAELSRLPFVMIAKAIFGSHLVRFSWSMAMILTGGLATFALAKLLFNLITIEKKKFSTKIIKVAALTAAIFYLFNPAMLQFFYAPLETFSSFYGFLPLIMWAMSNFIRDKSGKNLFILLLSAFFASSAFYVQTFFVVLVLTSGILSLSFLRKKHFLEYGKRILVAWLIIFAANAFWFLPLVIATINQSNDVFISKQNLVSTPQVKEMNQTYGSLSNIMLLHGYWFEYQEYNNIENDYTPYLGQWKDYWQNPLIKGIGYLLFFMCIIGFAGSFGIYKSKKILTALTIILLISLLMLTAGEGAIVGAPFRLMSKIQILGQMFRVSFTKWSIVASLCYGLGLGLFLLNLWIFCSKKEKKRQKQIFYITAGVIMLIALLQNFLVFRGQLFGWQVKVSLPQTYQRLSEFMETQDKEATVAYLPMPNYWGWLFYNWGYRGSGFLWQMIPQATLDRNFDVWSLDNQTAYQQLNLAIERNDVQLMEQVIHKYNLKMVILDSNIINAHVENQLVQSRANNEIQELMRQIKAKIIWQNEGITVYDLSAVITKPQIYIQSQYQEITNTNRQGLKDVIFVQEGNSINTPDALINYPFASNYQEEVEELSCNFNQCKIKGGVKGKKGAQSIIELPALKAGEEYIANGEIVFLNEKEIKVTFQPQLKLQVDEALYNLPVLQGLILAGVESKESEIILDFGDKKPYAVKKGQTTEFTTKLLVGQPLLIKLVDASLAEQVDDYIEVENVWVNNYDFPATIWEKIMLPPQISFKDEAKIAVSWEAPILELKFDKEAKAENCDANKKGEVKKNFTKQGLVMEATNFGNLCESYSLWQLSSLNDYLIQFQSQNISGNPLQFFVTDSQTKRLIIDQTLSKEKKEQYFYMPRLKILENQQNSLFLHLNNKSFGQLSENLLSQVKIVQFPIEYLSRIKIIEQTKQNSSNISLSYQLKDYASKHKDKYLVQVKSENKKLEQPQLLVLERAFDQNWEAWAQTKSGWKKLKHQLYNDWANAWTLPGNEEIQAIKIEFWPQKLVWVGLAMFGIALVGTSYYTYKKGKGSDRSRTPKF